MPRDHAGEGAEPEHPFAPYVRTLGRGPGRSRALTREEARDALHMVLQGEADPHQVGAFLMLLRYRGEDSEEMSGLVEAAQEVAGCGPHMDLAVDLDWPSYGAGRTRGEPWFLLAALALAGAGYRVAMHGTNAFSSGMHVPDALRLLGLRPAFDRTDATRMLVERRFAYLPLASLSPELDHLVNLRGLLGLRSPLNTAARLLNPFAARAGVDGVFHPPYIALHLDVAARLRRGRLLVVKGGGGEAERTPLKAVTAHIFDTLRGRCEVELPPTYVGAGARLSGQDLVGVWIGTAAGHGLATVLATIALALLAMGQAQSATEADALASRVWNARIGLT